jgi:hypothetical protein
LIDIPVLSDEELVTEVAWIVVYLSALSDNAISILVRSDVVPVLVGQLVQSESLQLLIPVLKDYKYMYISMETKITEVFQNR